MLKIFNGQNPLQFVNKLINQLEPIVQQILGTDSSSVGKIVDGVSFEIAYNYFYTITNHYKVAVCI